VRKPRGIDKRRPEQAKGEERRKQERFDCDGFAEVVVDDAAFLFRGNIQNLSIGGCYIQSRARLRLDRGAEADLHFNLSGDFFHARRES
jgi:PilZ domain